jgi:hypothetical protein
MPTGPGRLWRTARGALDQLKCTIFRSMLVNPERPAGPAVRGWLELAAIDGPVTDLRPDYAALVIVAEGLRPGPCGQATEALLRRVEAGLPRIDRITDIYNAMSVKHLLPIGGEDLAEYRGPVRLVRAAGDEPFDTIRDGQPVTEHPEPGEVVWRDDAGVTCRCWNWRQCVRTRITDATVSAVFILDGLAALGEGRLMTAGQDLAGQLTALHSGARLSWRRIGAGPAAAGPAANGPAANGAAANGAAANGAGPDARADAS